MTKRNIVKAIICMFIVGCGSEKDIEPLIKEPCGDTICGEHMVCRMNEDGTEECVCEEGYHKEGAKCIEDALALTCENITCSGHGMCVLIDDEPVCKCNSGYQAKGLECIEIEQACEEFECPANSFCIMEGGKPTCKCNNGYVFNRMKTECILSSLNCPAPPSPQGTRGEKIYMAVFGDATTQWYKAFYNHLYFYGSLGVWRASQGQHYIKEVIIEDKRPQYTKGNFNACAQFPCFQILNLHSSRATFQWEGNTRHKRGGRLEGFVMLGGRFGQYVFTHEWYHYFYEYFGETCAYQIEKCAVNPLCKVSSECYRIMQRWYPFTFPNRNWQPNSLPPKFCMHIKDH
jgi:hypothetical protein